MLVYIDIQLYQYTDNVIQGYKEGYILIFFIIINLYIIIIRVYYNTREKRVYCSIKQCRKGRIHKPFICTDEPGETENRMKNSLV